MAQKDGFYFEERSPWKGILLLIIIVISGIFVYNWLVPPDTGNGYTRPVTTSTTSTTTTSTTTTTLTFVECDPFPNEIGDFICRGMTYTEECDKEFCQLSSGIVRPKRIYAVTYHTDYDSPLKRTDLVFALGVFNTPGDAAICYEGRLNISKIILAMPEVVSDTSGYSEFYPDGSDGFSMDVEYIDKHGSIYGKAIFSISGNSITYLANYGRLEEDISNISELKELFMEFKGYNMEYIRN